jgi:hypothetical protein
MLATAIAVLNPIGILSKPLSLWERGLGSGLSPNEIGLQLFLGAKLWQCAIAPALNQLYAAANSSAYRWGTGTVLLHTSNSEFSTD